MEQATLKSYITGFALSLVLTVGAYVSVTNRLATGSALLAVIIGFALTQLMVQLIFFLHLGHESKPRWNLAILFSTLSIVFLIIVGSLWIMYHLNYNMTPMQMDEQVLHNEGIPVRLDE